MRIVDRNKNINRGYRKLEVWNEAIAIYTLVYSKLKESSNISYRTKNQIESSALSVSSNIAEGYSRRSLKENIQFVTIALASLSENYSQIYALMKTDQITEDWFLKYDDVHYKLENKLIKFNQSLIEKLESSDWEKNYYINKSKQP